MFDCFEAQQDIDGRLVWEVKGYQKLDELGFRMEGVWDGINELGGDSEKVNETDSMIR